MRITAKTTNGVLVGALALLLVYEALTLAFGTNATISEAFWRASFETPIVALAWGMLTGHFFWPKGVCVHCGLRPWGKTNDLRFGVLLRRYHVARNEDVDHKTAMAHARNLPGDA